MENVSLVTNHRGRSMIYEMKDLLKVKHVGSIGSVLKSHMDDIKSACIYSVDKDSVLLERVRSICNSRLKRSGKNINISSLKVKFVDYFVLEICCNIKGEDSVLDLVVFQVTKKRELKRRFYRDEIDEIETDDVREVDNVGE